MSFFLMPKVYSITGLYSLKQQKEGTWTAICLPPSFKLLQNHKNLNMGMENSFRPKDL